MNEQFKGKNVLVLGLARSGMAAIKVLNLLGANITLSELKAPSTEELEFLNSINVKVIGQELSDLTGDYDLVIKNPGIPPISDIVTYFKQRNIPIITEIELAYQVSKPQHYVAITGTNGKTTTTTLVYELLKEKYQDKAHVGGNIGTPLCELVLDYNLMEEEGHYISLEISNHQLVDIDTFRSDMSTIINLTPDHLKTMGSLDNYYISKTLVYKNMKDDDVFLYNLDDENIKEYTNRYPINCKIETFSLTNKDAYGHLQDGYMYINNESVLPLDCIKIVGDHNKQNILIAAMVAKRYGVSNEEIYNVISNFKGVEHRIEFVRELNGIRYYNDSKATNTDATITALKAFDKNVILLVGGFEKGLPMDDVKKYLGCVKKVIGYGVAGNRIASDLVDNPIIVEDLKQAVNEANVIAKPGDIVLLSPTTSSFDQYTGYEQRGQHFKEIVNNL